MRLAEACDRLILHYREDTLDTYLVNDEGTVYRYQARHTGVVWGEWSTSPVAARDSVRAAERRRKRPRGARVVRRAGRAGVYAVTGWRSSTTS